MVTIEGASCNGDITGGQTHAADSATTSASIILNEMAARYVRIVCPGENSSACIGRICSVILELAVVHIENRIRINIVKVADTSALGCIVM
jgi:hypothetical protein